MLAMLAALLWGAAHTLTPGHGKALVAACLVVPRLLPVASALASALVVSLAGFAILLSSLGRAGIV